MTLRALTTIVTTNLAEFLMLAVGLRCRIHDVLSQARNRSLIARELALVTIGVPLLTLLVLQIVPIPPVATSIALLFAICPAAPYVLRTFRKHKAMPKALTVVAIGLVASVVVIPTWIAVLNAYFGYAFRVPLYDVLTILALKVFVPLSAGLILRRFAPKSADVVAHVINILVLTSLVGTTVIMLRDGAGSLRYLTPRVILVLVLVSTGSALLGELAGGRDHELREILGNTAMNGNPAIALTIIGASYPDMEVGGFVAAYLICRAVASGPYLLLGLVRRRLARHAARGHVIGSARGPASSDTR